MEETKIKGCLTAEIKDKNKITVGISFDGFDGDDVLMLQHTITTHLAGFLEKNKNCIPEVEGQIPEETIADALLKVTIAALDKFLKNNAKSEEMS